MVTWPWTNTLTQDARIDYARYDVQFIFQLNPVITLNEYQLNFIRLDTVLMLGVYFIHQRKNTNNEIMALKLVSYLNKVTLSNSYINLHWGQNNVSDELEFDRSLL